MVLSPRKYMRMRYFVWIVLLIFFLLYWFSLPDELFKVPSSTVIDDKDGYLLGAKIASDEQWRFPHNPDVPEKFKIAIIEFEDGWFYKHPGFNPISLFRATYQNISQGKIISGGSTLTMQVIRLSRKKSRTIFEKLIEIILATRLELTYSKDEILALYASNAPFGGNVVGLDAASWRYFGRSAEDLSWSEAATLAVLPNAPSLIYPGRNQEDLFKKRNRLLNKLLTKGYLDSLSCDLAKSESLPAKPVPIPQQASHLLNRALALYPKVRTKTTINRNLQIAVTNIIASHHQTLKYNEVHNAAAIVVEVETGEVRAYIGNTRNTDGHEHANDVDVITAPRSSGSILKPVLYAAMLEAGEMLPNTLFADLPVQLGGYTPKNFTNRYDGAVPASKALSRSLNIPAVKMLQQYDVHRFYDLLRKLGFQTLNNSSGHYGLSLILGGAETTLWDLAGVYAGFSRVLNHFYDYSGKYDPADWHAPILVPSKKDNKPVKLINESPVRASAIWLTYEALLEVNRPAELVGWESFASSRKIAWKTGTSFGFRDAWAVGATPNYVVAVWVGNADGEGRSGLTGVSSAAPIMFDIFNLLPSVDWFTPPFDEMVEIPVCSRSGYRVSINCEDSDTVWVQKSGLRTSTCPYHQLVHLDESGKFRVRSDCYEPSKMKHKPWFVLPPVMEYYYWSHHPEYKSLPTYLSDCMHDFIKVPMEFIYPTSNNRLYLPVELDGSLGSIILEVAHQSRDITIYWHLDNDFLGSTSGEHKIPIQPNPGIHRITLIDENGNQLSKRIEILKREE